MCLRGKCLKGELNFLKYYHYDSKLVTKKSKIVAMSWYSIWYLLNYLVCVLSCIFLVQKGKCNWATWVRFTAMHFSTHSSIFHKNKDCNIMTLCVDSNPNKVLSSFWRNGKAERAPAGREDWLCRVYFWIHHWVIPSANHFPCFFFSYWRCDYCHIGGKTSFLMLLTYTRSFFFESINIRKCRQACSQRCR